MWDYLNHIQDALKAGDATVIGIIVAVVVVFITILFLVCRGSGSKKKGVLLVGLSDSGKTLLFCRLVENRFVDTQTSIKENNGSYQATSGKSRSLRVIDLPGYERLRNIYLDQYKPLARGIIFVVDSSSVTREVKEVGEYLYHLLTDTVISSNNTPILIACNKQDQTLAKGAIVIKRLLEKELDTVRKTQAAALGGTGTVHNNNMFLGRRNKEFEFSDLKPLKVEFVECSLRGSKDDEDKFDMDDVVTWLNKLA